MKYPGMMCGVAMASLIAWGQDAVPAKMVDKLIQLKYADAREVLGVVSILTHGDIRASTNLHTIAVHASADSVAAVEDAVKKLDVPPVDFEVTVYLISTAPQGGDQLPDALSSTAKQLHGVFAYKSYQLMDSFVLRGRDGQGGSADGTIKNSTYSFRFNRASVLESAPRTINLQNLNLTVRFPTGMRNEKGQLDFKNTGLSTDIDIRDGQKVVVGKSDVNNGESPLILVVTAKVVE
jgi:hypothetical protein